MLRVLLDTSDLINVLERSCPITADELESYLRSHSTSLVLTFATVLEFVRPILDNGDFLHFRPLLQRLERMPLLFLSNAHAPMQELRQASAAFLSGLAYTDVNPYVSRWEETAQLPGVSICEALVGLRIDEAVYMIWKSDPTAIKGPAGHLDLLRAAVAADRECLGSTPIRAVENFPNTIRKYLQRSGQYGFAFPENRIHEFASWIYAVPRRCPGLRLHYELYHKKLVDSNDPPKSGDICDNSLASCLPYVEAISVDKRTANYLRLACRQLERTDPDLAYSKRINTGLAAILQTKL